MEFHNLGAKPRVSSMVVLQPGELFGIDLRIKNRATAAVTACIGHLSGLPMSPIISRPSSATSG